MTLYKIYVGLTDKNGKPLTSISVENIVKYSGIIQGATLYKTTGYWQGKEEFSIIIETTSPKAYELARELKIALNQESVLLTIQSVDVQYI
jgi:hypothetical protein